jgi:hypothetical protein
MAALLFDDRQMCSGKAGVRIVPVEPRERNR